MLLSSNFIILNPSARSISHSLFLKESKYALELSRSFTRPTLATQSPIGSSSILGGKVKHFKYHSASVNAVYSSPLHQNHSSKGFSHFSSTSLLVGGIVISIANDIHQYKNTVCTTSCGWFGKDENNGKDDDDILEKIKKAVDEYISPILDSTGLKLEGTLENGVPGKLSYGFICGFSSGYALKKVGKAGAVAFGLGFAVLQTMSYNGYITINFDKMNSDFKKALDINDDGDVDEKDVQEITDKTVDILSYNLPAGSGFSVGFFMGVKAG